MYYIFKRNIKMPTNVKGKKKTNNTHKKLKRDTKIYILGYFPASESQKKSHSPTQFLPCRDLLRRKTGKGVKRGLEETPPPGTHRSMPARPPPSLQSLPSAPSPVRGRTRTSSWARPWFKAVWVNFASSSGRSCFCLPGTRKQSG